MKTRSSSGVGQKVDLGFTLESLRILDLGEDADYQQHPTGSKIMDSIKNKAGSGNAEVGKITANIQSSKLKDMLAGLKSE